MPKNRGFVCVNTQGVSLKLLSHTRRNLVRAAIASSFSGTNCLCLPFVSWTSSSTVRSTNVDSVPFQFKHLVWQHHLWDVSRLGRSLQHLIILLEAFQTYRVHLYSHQQALDTSTPSSKAMFQMLAVFNEFERGILKERVKAGLGRTKAEGKKSGHPTVPPVEIRRIRKLREEGLSYRKIAKRVDLSVCTVHRLCA